VWREGVGASECQLCGARGLERVSVSSSVQDSEKARRDAMGTGSAQAPNPQASVWHAQFNCVNHHHAAHCLRL
jgi:hypothetical protein